MTEELAAGHEVERDPETGQITTKHLSSERAREIGAKGGQALLKKQIEASADLAEVLEHLVDHPDDLEARKKAHKLTLRAVATQIQKGRVNRSEFDVLASVLDDVFTRGGPRPPQHGQKCALCGEVKGKHDIQVQLSPEILEEYG